MQMLFGVTGSHQVLPNGPDHDKAGDVLSSVVEFGKPSSVRTVPPILNLQHLTLLATQHVVGTCAKHHRQQSSVAGKPSVALPLEPIWEFPKTRGPSIDANIF